MTVCGIDCNQCFMHDTCKGCEAICDKCLTYKCYKNGGEKEFLAFKNQLVSEFNALGVTPKINDLNKLSASFVNLKYPLSNGQKIKLFDDSEIILGNQIEGAENGRCYGVATDGKYLLVCEYGENGANPEIVVYKRR